MPGRLLGLPYREELEYPTVPGATDILTLPVPEATNLCLGSLVQNSVSRRRRLIDILEDERTEVAKWCELHACACRRTATIVGSSWKISGFSAIP
jgi:hypothetical protein